MNQFNAPGLKTASIPLENREGVRGGEKPRGIERHLGAKNSGEGAEEEDTKWADGDERLKTRVGQ